MNDCIDWLVQLVDVNHRVLQVFLAAKRYNYSKEKNKPVSFLLLVVSGHWDGLCLDQRS